MGLSTFGRREGSRGFRPAVRTQPDKLQSVAENQKVRGAFELLVDVEPQLDEGIHQPVAPQAADVIVVVGFSVETLQVASRIDPADLA